MRSLIFNDYFIVRRQCKGKLKNVEIARPVHSCSPVRIYPRCSNNQMLVSNYMYTASREESDRLRVRRLIWTFGDSIKCSFSQSTTKIIVLLRCDTVYSFMIFKRVSNFVGKKIFLWLSSFWWIIWFDQLVYKYLLYDFSILFWLKMMAMTFFLSLKQAYG